MATTLFEKLTVENVSVNQTEYCYLRDHLYSVIHFGNGHRSGVYANMQMVEFTAVKRVESMFVIKVWKHKTVKKYGPANVTLIPRAYEMLKIFVQKVRPQLHCKCSNVFLSWSGAALTSGDISKRLHILWCRAGIFDDSLPVKNITCNIVRKSTSTGLRVNETGCYQEAADLMTHSLTTEKEKKNIREKEKSAAVAGTTIRSHFY